MPFRHHLRILLGAVSLSACNDAPIIDPHPPKSNLVAGGALNSRLGLVNYDEKLLELALRAPGFGGVRYDENGTAIVFVTDLTKAGQIGPVVAEFLGNRSRSDAVAGGFVGSPMRFVKADFAWPEIKAWKDRLRGIVFRDPGVSFIDADEGHNRITIGIVASADEPRIRALAEESGAPPGLLRFVQEAKPTYRATLREAYSPRIGGLQIESGGFICTLGFIASYNYVGNRALVTNSHCTAAMFQNTGSVISQGGATVGIEVNDIPLFQDTYGCPPGRWCRNSDAAVIDLNDGIASEYRIAFTSLPPCYDMTCKHRLTINGEMPIVGDDFAVQGMELNKTGRTTGWTRGTVTNTCADTPSDPLFWAPAGAVIEPLMLCQIHTTIWSEGGDSGSPVYKRTTYTAGEPGFATMYGIMWGGPPNDFNVTWVSTIYGVNADVGALGWW